MGAVFFLALLGLVAVLLIVRSKRHKGGQHLKWLYLLEVKLQYLKEKIENVFCTLEWLQLGSWRLSSVNREAIMCDHC